MVTCSCGKVIDKVPDWLSGVKVEFICNNCPNRQTKNIAFVNLEPVALPEDPMVEPKNLEESEDEV